MIQSFPLYVPLVASGAAPQNVRPCIIVLRSLGYVTREEIQEMLDALGATLRKLGFTPSG